MGRIQQLNIIEVKATAVSAAFHWVTVDGAAAQSAVAAATVDAAAAQADVAHAPEVLIKSWRRQATALPWKHRENINTKIRPTFRNRVDCQEMDKLF